MEGTWMSSDDDFWATPWGVFAQRVRRTLTKSPTVTFFFESHKMQGSTNFLQFLTQHGYFAEIDDDEDVIKIIATKEFASESQFNRERRFLISSAKGFSVKLDSWESYVEQA